MAFSLWNLNSLRKVSELNLDIGKALKCWFEGVIYIYIELKVLTTNFGRQRAFEMRTIFVINVCRAALS